MCYPLLYPISLKDSFTVTPQCNILLTTGFGVPTRPSITTYQPELCDYYDINIWFWSYYYVIVLVITLKINQPTTVITVYPDKLGPVYS